MLMAKFNLGQLFMTRKVNDKVADNERFAKFVWHSLKRHAAGDWGTLCHEDIQENELSLKEAFRLLSSYKSGENKIWIITEADRSVTTILFPEDYRRRK